MSAVYINVRSVGRRTWPSQQTVLALGVTMLGKTEWRICQCCEKWHEIKPLKQVGLTRRKSLVKGDGLYHDFIKHMPPRKAWKKVRIYCIICNEEHDLLRGPVTGKLYSQVCDRF